MRPNTIGLIWAAGIVLTLLVYAVGPDRFLWIGYDVIAGFRGFLHTIFAALAVNTFELMRALAIGLYPVFLGLGLLAARRGLRARGALIGVTLVLLVLLFAPLEAGAGVSDLSWTVAFATVVAGCVVMTGRLRSLPAATPARWTSSAP